MTLAVKPQVDLKNRDIGKNGHNLGAFFQLFNTYAAGLMMYGVGLNPKFLGPCMSYWSNIEISHSVAIFFLDEAKVILSHSVCNYIH